MTIDINAHLNSKAKRLEDVTAALRHVQILDACTDASAAVVERLNRCAGKLADTVNEIESIQDGR